MRTWWKKHSGITCAAVGVAVSLLSDISIYAVLPTAFGDLGLEQWQVGLVLSANRWVRLLTNYPVGIAAKTYPEYIGEMFSMSLLLGCICSACYAISQRFWVLMIGRCLWGAAWSAIRNSALLCVRNVVKSGDLPAGEATGYYDGVSRVGAVVGLIAAGPIYDSLSFSWLFGIWCAIAFVAVPLGKISHSITIKQLSTSTFEDTTSGPTTSCRTACKQPPQKFALLAIAFITGCVSWGLVIGTLGMILKEQYGEEVDMGAFSVKIATFNSIVLGVRWTLEVLGTPLLGRLCDRVGRKKASLVSFVIGTLGTLSCLLLPAKFMFVGIMLLFISASSVSIAALTEAVDTDMISSFVNLQDLGSSLGTVTAYAIPYTGLSAKVGVFSTIVVLYFCGVLLSFKAYESAGRSDLSRPLTTTSVERLWCLDLSDSDPDLEMDVVEE
eukprot:TRINITY_DN3200_c1_g1_i3.p1 TRINITY_DN3200_c1_g1~~TRINITY_DN3200_c1_g1_i3.p1  ORF type:complete len:440 (+),score=63.18 TRINITY_DN3200_c1_g1_i3:49-1368(+)